jgi:hypothetical protein
MGGYFVDTSVPFGYRHGTQACSCMGIFVLNYIDNIIGFAPKNIADTHFLINHRYSSSTPKLWHLLPVPFA